MATTQQVPIKDLLRELNDTEFKELKYFFDEGLPIRIPYAVVEHLDRLDTGKKIQKTYGAESMKYTMMGLKKMDMTELVQKYSHAVSAPKRSEADTSDGGETPGSRPAADTSDGGETPGSRPAASTSHFVDQHRVDLIVRVKMVDSILDRLLAEGVITHEGHSNVRSKTTSMEKMRGIYELLESGGTKAKEIFYKGLERNEQFLLQDLKQK